MISYSQFEEIVVNELKRDISSNQDQKIAISSKKDQSLFIVAGPGSGKTTVMVLKILKFIFVDDISPKEILATTFTRKAANELNSRILSWGDEIKKSLLKIITDEKKVKNLAKIDFNQIVTGTIDSIAEEILRVHRDPGTNLPVVIEEFVANSAMINSGLFKDDRYLNEDLKKYLGTINGVEEVKNPSIMSDILLDIKNRLYYDQVDIEQLLENETSPGAKEALKAVLDYLSELKERNILDFPMLESRFLNWLNSGKLDIFLNDLKIILVDEYQDTNLLQEKIYFKLAKSAIANDGNITVVGDDDQSLYRFRGATVNLFTNFIERAKKELNINVKEVNLSANYRSTEDIVNLCNHFVELDDKFQSARVKEKPKIEFSRVDFDSQIETNHVENNKENIPVIGMFRQNQEILAKDLSILLRDLVEGKTVKKKIKKILKPNKSIENSFEKSSKKSSKRMINKSCEDLSNETYEKLIKEPYEGLSKEKYEELVNESYEGLSKEKYEELVNGSYEGLSKVKYEELVNGSYEGLSKVKYEELVNGSYEGLSKVKYEELVNESGEENNENFKKDDLKQKNLKKNSFIELKLNEEFGSPSDLAILTYSPKELSYGNYMFPYYLRKNLMNFKNPIDVFNPRGKDLQTLTPVAIFCGLILECIDPESKIQNSIKKIPAIAKKNMNKWRRIANEYIDTNPEPVQPISLETFVNCWRTRTPYAYEPNVWPETASLIELAYKLISWIDDLQDDIEGLVYLEAITQTITQTGFFNKYSAQIYFDDNKKEEKASIEEAIWNIFIPIATGGVSVDEKLLDTLPKNRVNIMSIHQSKGLEFPFVIVDVGSRFKKNKIKTSFLRFPKEGGKSTNLEDKIRPYSPLGVDDRDSKDRAFDDLTRLYFVAFSRAQDVLLLVGLNSAIDGYIANEKQMNIPNIALGWRRDEIFVGFDEIYLI